MHRTLFKCALLIAFSTLMGLSFMQSALAETGRTDAPSKPQFNIPLWEKGKVPQANGDGPLDTPFVTICLPARPNGSSVVIAPGGSNIMLMYGGEGIEIAEKFNDWGFTAFILTYRLSPKYSDSARLADGQRAIRLVRSRASEWKLDPKKIGFAGFSAGSYLARAVAANADAGKQDATDSVDRISSRPDYLVMVYGPGRPTPTEQFKQYPPTFLLSAAADAGAANGTAQLFIDLNRAGAVAELHMYQKGRHGFGAALRSPEFSPWMEELRHFLQVGGFISDSAKTVL